MFATQLIGLVHQTADPEVLTVLAQALLICCLAAAAALMSDRCATTAAAALEAATCCLNVGQLLLGNDQRGCCGPQHCGCDTEGGFVGRVD